MGLDGGESGASLFSILFIRLHHGLLKWTTAAAALATLLIVGGPQLSSLVLFLGASMLSHFLSNDHDENCPRILSESVAQLTVSRSVDEFTEHWVPFLCLSVQTQHSHHYANID